MGTRQQFATATAATAPVCAMRMPMSHDETPWTARRTRGTGGVRREERFGLLIICIGVHFYGPLRDHLRRVQGGYRSGIGAPTRGIRGQAYCKAWPVCSS